MRKFSGALLRDTRGATAIEYGLIVALIVLAMMGALSLFGQTAIDKWEYVSEKVVNA